MPNGYGYGRGFRRWGGAGFGFRGASPPWPYVGRGRGGLPRCFYPGLYGPAPVPGYSYGTPSVYGYGTPPAPGYPYAAPWDYAQRPAPAPEEEVELLRGQADAIRQQLEAIEGRIQGLQGEKEQS